MDNNIYASVLSSIRMAIIIIIELFVFFKRPGVWHINPEGPVKLALQLEWTCS